MAILSTRKLLFLVFSDDSCRQMHALLYAVDLHQKGYEVRVILEGLATRALHELSQSDSRLGALLQQAQQLGILAGACARAAAGCASNDPTRDVTAAARAAGIELLSDLEGHAGIESFVHDGFELVTF